MLNHGPPANFPTPPEPALVNLGPIALTCDLSQLENQIYICDVELLLRLAKTHTFFWVSDFWLIANVYVTGLRSMNFFPISQIFQNVVT